MKGGIGSIFDTLSWIETISTQSSGACIDTVSADRTSPSSTLKDGAGATLVAVDKWSCEVLTSSSIARICWHASNIDRSHLTASHLDFDSAFIAWWAFTRCVTNAVDHTICGSSSGSFSVSRANVAKIISGSDEPHRSSRCRSNRTACYCWATFFAAAFP